MNGNDLQGEMRLVETEDGWATALEPDLGAFQSFFLGIGASFLAIVGASVIVEMPALMLLMTLAFPAIFTLGYTRWTHIRLRPRSIEIGSLHTRAVPTPEQTRKGQDSGGLVVQRRPATRSLPFSEVNDLGFTDYSVWFAVGDERVEVPLSTVSRADIQRLHDEIRGVWERYRASLQDTEAEADARRRQLASLQKT